jgi:phosphate-selective porin OprO/OprP
MNTKRLISLFTATAGLALASTASADEALLNLLVDKGIVTRAEASQLMAESKSSAPSRPIITSSSTNLSQLRIRGRIQTQFGAVDMKDQNGNSGKYSTLEMRRVRLGMQGRLLQNVRARMEANFVPGATFSMRSAYLEWRENEWGYVKVGYDKPVFGFEENTSSASILTVERSLLSNELAPGAQTGVTFDGKMNIFSYAAGIYTTNQVNNTRNDGDDGSGRYLFTISGGVKLDDMLPEGNKLALRADFQKNNDAQTGAPTANNTRRVFDEAMSLSAHYQTGKFDLRTEYLRANNLRNDRIHGFYVMPSLFFTDKVQGVVRYEWAGAQNGADFLRHASRYARRVTDGGVAGGARGDEYWALYGGVNYYLAGDAHKLMLGLEYAELDTTNAAGLSTGTSKATTLYGAWRMLF